MNVPSVLAQIEKLQEQTQMLANRLQHSGERVQQLSSGQQDAIQPLIEDLSNAVEELHVAQEELRAQNEQLSSAYGELEQERRRYQELFESVPDPYFVTDGAGRIRAANRAVSALLGVPRTYVLGKPLLAFVAKQDQPLFATRLARLAREGGEQVREFELCMRPRRQEAETLTAVRAVARMDASGQVVELRWLIRDITAQRRTDSEVKELNSDLERRVRERTAQVDSANRVNSSLLAVVESEMAVLSARYQRLVENGASGVFVVDAAGGLVSVNPALARLLAVALPALLPKSRRATHRAFADRGSRRAVLRRLREDGACTRLPVSLRRADGPTVQVYLSAWVTRDRAGRPSGVEGIVEAMPERREGAARNGAGTSLAAG